MKRALFALSLFLVSCGGGGGGSAAAITPAANFAGQSYIFGLSSPPAAGGGVAASPAQAANGTLTLPPGNAPGNVTIFPALPAQWPSSLALLPAGNSPVVLLSVVADSSMSLAGTPVLSGSFSVAAAGSAASGATPPPIVFFLAEYTATGWRTVDAATISGAVVSFAGTSVPVGLVKGVPTYFVLYVGGPIP